MKPSVTWSCACLVVSAVATTFVGCSSDKDPAPTGTYYAGAPGSAGATTAAGAGGAPPSGGSTSAGTGGANGGSTSAGAGAGAGAGGTPGSGGAGGGTAGAGGGSAGAASTGFKCPAGPFAAFAAPTAKATHVAGAPPNDSFNMNNFTNVEGPVWIGDSLYFSEMTGSNIIPPARILKIAPGGVVSVVVPDAGSNGLAVDGMGNLIAAVHKDGSISQIALPGGAATPLVSMFNGTRFTSPNDLAIRSDGVIYFSDPKYQNNANPQKGEHLYRVTAPPTRTPSIVADAPSTPNGVTLSPDEKTLYVSGSGLKKFTVMTDGTLSASTDFVVGGGGDGMAVDCAGNLYVAGDSAAIRVYSSAGMLLGKIQADGSGNTTNVAFGGTDHKTLYLTAQGNDGQRGVWSIPLTIPGFPY